MPDKDERSRRGNIPTTHRQRTQQASSHQLNMRRKSRKQGFGIVEKSQNPGTWNLAREEIQQPPSPIWRSPAGTTPSRIETVDRDDINCLSLGVFNRVPRVCQAEQPRSHLILFSGGHAEYCSVNGEDATMNADAVEGRPI